MPRFPVVSLFAAALLAAPVFAQQSLPRTDPVVVTAVRAAETPAQTLAAVDVIEREEIERSASQDVAALLRRVPGVDVVRGGGIGQQASVFIRGTNSNQALVLIDGVRVSALGTGSYAWEHLPIAQIERIEVVRGPRAAVWGADALGGVIQIFTRREAAPYTNLQIGNHDTYGVDAGIGQRDERGGFGVHLGWLETRGQNATRPQHFSFDPDRDGAQLRNLSVYGDVALAGHTLEARALHSDNEVEFDQGQSQTRQDVQSLTLSGDLAPNWQHRLTLGGSRDRLETPAFFAAYRSRRQQADWLHTVAVGRRDQLVVGLSWLDERASQTDTLADATVYRQSRHTSAAFANWQHASDVQLFEVSGRRDDNSVYGNQTSFAAAWGWDASPLLRVSASWGQGFRAPTMNELYSPGFGGWYAGNPALAAERSHSAELALRLTPSVSNEVVLRVFRNDIDDMIDFSGAQAQAINIARARIDGSELVWRWHKAWWNLEANATWQDPRSRDTGDALLRRPARKASVLLERGFDSGLRFGLEAMAASQRPDFGGVRLPGYGLLALRARLPLGLAWQLDARLENLLNRDYTLVDGYHTPGATALLTLRWRGRQDPF